MTELTLQIQSLPAEVMEQVRLYAWVDPVKADLQEYIDKKETEYNWLKVSDEWLCYCQEIEDWSLVWGRGFSIDGSGIAAVYRDEKDVRLSSQEHWRRQHPIRFAKGGAEKQTVTTLNIDWDSEFVEIMTGDDFD